MKMSLREACFEALNDLRHIQTDFRGGVTIYAIDKNGEYCVLSVKSEYNGLPECDPYFWYWNGMDNSVKKIDAECFAW